MMQFVRGLLVHMETVILLYFLLVNSFYALLLTAAVVEMRRHLRRTYGESRWRVLSSSVAPRVSILAPAYNEAATVADSVRALLTLSYPNLEIIVINDGSKDDTIGVLRSEFDLVPVHPIYNRRIDSKSIEGIYHSRRHAQLVVVDKLNGGKADALNAGLNVATGELVCAMDADTLIEPDALQRMVRPFLFGDDVIAAGGTIRVANGSQVRGGRIVEFRAPTQMLAGIQVVEYLRAFLFGRLGWNRLGGNLVISGAFGLFRLESMIGVGGYTHDTVGEDIELVLKLRRQAYEAGIPHDVVFVPDPVAWTEVPESMRVLGRQRDRWHRGLADVIMRHRRLIFNPSYGALGLVILPYFVFVELIAPIVEVIGILGLVVGLVVGAVNAPFAILFFLVAYGYGVLLTLATLLLDQLSFHRYIPHRDRLLLLWYAVIENFGYRQITVLWRLRGLIGYVRGRKEWGAMERRGIGEQQKPAA
jgi:cellulose synthase/poly-beta-1,6-N-acetylglucosamine synthase-like glycosyltransferase